MANEESIKREEEALRRLMDLKSDYVAVLKEEQRNVLEYTRVKKALTAAEEANADNVAELRETVETYRATMDSTEKEILEMTETIEKQSESIRTQREELAKSEKRLASFRAGLDKLTNSNISSITSMKGFFDNIVNVTFALESQSIGLARTTGYTKDFADNLTGLTKRNAVLGISLEESAKIISGLSTGMSRFNAVGDAQQSVLEDISARFMRLGVDSKEFGSALDTINYAFGLTGQAAAEAGKSLEGLASEIGRPLDSVVQDLNDIGPTLGRFGQQGIQVFRKLATQARELGLTTKQAFDVSELFDTFEGAANIAGRLNAQLGLQLNSVELMKASSEDRLDILRSEFQLQGKSFESMGRRQRQMIASILGKDEETAARLLGDKMDISRFQKEKAEEKTITDMVTMQEQMTNLMQQIALPLSEYLLDVVTYVKLNYDVISKWVPRIAVAVIAMKALSGAGNLIQSLGGGAGRGGVGRLLQSGGGLLSKGAGAAAGMGGFLSKGLGKMAAKRIPIIGGLLGAGMNIASGEGIGRSIFGGLGAAGGTLLGALGGGGIASIPLAMAGGYGGEKLGTGLYDKIFGAPTGPSTTNAEMNTTMRQNRQAARGGTTMPNITLPVELKVDGKVWATSTVKVMNDQLALTKSN